jgi:hypothetical protein
VLRSVIALAHELGKNVVAEGVEAEDDVAFLRSIGCEYAQGYYYGEAMAERDVLQLLKVVRRAERRVRKSSLFRQRVRARAETVSDPAAAAEAPPRRGRGQQPAPLTAKGAVGRPPRVSQPRSPSQPAAMRPPMPPPPAKPANGAGALAAGPPPLPRRAPPAQTPPPAEPNPAAVQLDLPPTPLRPGSPPTHEPERVALRPPPVPNGANAGQRPPPPARPAPPAGARRGGPPPLPPGPSARPPPDVSRLPPAIRASLARLAGEIADEQAQSEPKGPGEPGAS